VHKVEIPSARFAQINLIGIKRAFFFSHSFADPGFPRCCVGKPLNTWFMWVAYSTGLLVASLRKRKKKTED
jgi:hypothetical protein